MRTFFSLLVALDARIQRRFDAAIHWCMQRFGWTKRGIRRTVWTLLPIIVVGFGAMSMPGMPLLMRGFMVLCGGTASAVWIANMNQQERADIEAESTLNARSATDNPGRALYYKFLGTIFFLMSGWMIWKDDALITVMCVLSSAIFLFQGYLIGTSPQAPKPKKELARNAELVPIPVRR